VKQNSFLLVIILSKKEKNIAKLRNDKIEKLNNELAQKFEKSIIAKK
jgi:hypothetical protein